MDYNIHKICRVCLEEAAAGPLTSIYSPDFAMMPSVMLMQCAKIRIYKTDGLPSVICNNCIYRLGVAFHFKQECENNDIRLRQYLGIHESWRQDAATNTELTEKPLPILLNSDDDDDDDDGDGVREPKQLGKRSRYQRKPRDQHKKRGPKPVPKLPHTCYECHKHFKCLAQLTQHIRTHTGEKPFECQYCRQRFAQRYNLKVHERTHTGDKPFQCEICSKQFSALGNFQAHQKIHIGVRDQICTLCQKAFYTAGDLSKHMITHTGIKNHNCDVCGKAFSRRRDMRTHKLKLHPLESSANHQINDEEDDDEAIDTDPVGLDHTEQQVVAASVPPSVAHFKCPDCDKAYVSADSLSLHFRSHSMNCNLLNLPLAHPHAPPPPPPPAPPMTHHHYSQMGMMHMLPPPPPPPSASTEGRYTMLHHPTATQRLHY